MYLTSIVCLTFVAVTSVNAPNVVVYQSPLDYTRAIFEIFLLLNAARILEIEIYQIIRLKKEYLVDKMNIVEITSPVMLILLLPVRYIHEQTHWYIYAVTYLVWFLQIIKYAPVFKFTGVFVDSLQKMFVKDILRFGIILSITIVVFSGTFLLVLKAENTLQLHEETTSFWKIGIVGIRIMIESDGIVEYTGDDGYKFAGAMVMMAFMFFIIVVLLNMMIAKLMNTYREIENTSLNGFHVRRAKIVARLEREHMPFPFDIFKIVSYLLLCK
ncbi:uncharacterized protein LOC132718240 [Ruditapes philippinarum]|uniref:uncharacterized protein LOC132718240 n=1 Tax=Ruditapes philippinarum TaxID=129788 RepID=UPI00295AAF3C|nr:uncharacterized protein LOC132718240 [Ruditapes philippinarum]